MGVARYKRRRFFQRSFAFEFGYLVVCPLSINLSVLRRAGAWCEVLATPGQPAHRSVCHGALTERA